MSSLTQLELFPVDEGLESEAALSKEAVDKDSANSDSENSVQTELETGREYGEEEGEAIAAQLSDLSMDGLDEQQLTIQVRTWLEPLTLHGLSNRVSVRWNPRLQTTAGRAHYEESRIEINPQLITWSDIHEIERTLKHELAHLVAYERCSLVERRRLQPHGLEWQLACDDLGISGEDRCHNLELPGRRMKRKFLYRCPECGDRIERVRRYKGHVACYDCCRKYSRGRYDQRFRLVESRLG